MKKFSIFLLGMLGMLASSCVDEIEPAKPQENPQEPILEVGNVSSSAAGVLSSQGILNLDNYTTPDAKIEIMHLGETKDLPAGASVSYQIQLAKTDDFANAITLIATAGTTEDTKNNFYVNAEDWNKAHISLFGKSPKEKTVYYRVPVYVDVDGSNYRLGGTDFYAVSGSLTETCMDSGFVIEDNYYLLGNATTWDLGEAATLESCKFEHDPEVSPYDDPVFVIKFEVSEDVASNGGNYWKIAPQSAVDTQDWATVLGTATNGDTATTGMLTNSDPQAGLIPEAGKYKMTVNMETMEYTIVKVLQPEYLYTPGDSNGWNQLDSAWLQVFKKEDNGEVVEQYYYGVSPLSANGFKICAEPKWDNATDYGSEDGEAANSGSLILGQTGKNIIPESTALYWIKVNYETKGYQMTDYVLTPITKVGIIGSFEGSGWSKDLELTSEDNGASWSADITLAEGNEFKVRFNENWDYNLGGEMKALVFDGGNIKATEAGEFTITVTFLKGVPAMTLTKK